MSVPQNGDEWMAALAKAARDLPPEINPELTELEDFAFRICTICALDLVELEKSYPFDGGVWYVVWAECPVCDRQEEIAA